MKRCFYLLLLCLPLLGKAQTWSDDIASITYNKCSGCHHSGGIAPFSLMSYSDVSAMISTIHDAITTGEMPPWPPDNQYQQYSHPRSLSATEKTTYLSWLDNGAPERNAQNTPPPPVFNNGSVLGTGDLTVQIPTYMSKAQGGQDDYVCFSIPSNLGQNRFIRAIEIVPGNREIVHHCLVYVDQTGSYQGDTVGGDCGGPSNGTLIGGYTPGSSPLVFPSGSTLKLGMQMPANSNIVLAMHYPEGSYGMYDSTKVIFHFYPVGESGIREVLAAPVLQNWSLSIPPDQLSNFTARYPASGSIPASYSLLSVFPHMHLLGKSMKVYGINASGDSLPLAKVHQWDFHWQDFYFFQYLQKIPSGSYLKAEATYDNTVNNPDNPNDPPQWVYAGEGTTDEMFLVYFHFLAYQAGDENINLENLLTLGTNSNYPETAWRIYPSPFEQQITLSASTLSQGDVVSVYVYDMEGKQVKILADKHVLSSGNMEITWNGCNENGTAVGSGTYYLSINHNGEMQSFPVIRK